MKRLDGNFYESSSVYVTFCVTLNSFGSWNAACVPHRKTAHGRTATHMWSNTWRLSTSAHNFCWLSCFMDWRFSTSPLERQEQHTHEGSLRKRNTCFFSCFIIGKVGTASCRLPDPLGSWPFLTVSVVFPRFWVCTFFLPPCSRISPMTNLKWNSMLTLLMVWWWRATCSRGPAMPLRPGTGMLHRHDWMYWMLVMLWNTWEFICFYCHHFFSSVLVRPLKLRHHLRHCVKLPFLSSFSSFSSVMENNLSQNVTFVKFKLFQHWQVFWTIFCQRQFLSFTQSHLFYTQH